MLEQVEFARSGSDVAPRSIGDRRCMCSPKILIFCHNSPPVAFGVLLWARNQLIFELDEYSGHTKAL
jgi:hypothetical protein